MKRKIANLYKKDKEGKISRVIVCVMGIISGIISFKIAIEFYTIVISIVIAIFGAYIGALISVLFFSAIATICGVKPDFEEERK